MRRQIAPGSSTQRLGRAPRIVTGLAEALNAGIPLIAITGNTNREHSWKNMTQEARQLEVLRPVVKEVLRVEVPKRIPELVRRAFAVATSGRPGPVLIDMPEDVAHAELAFDAADFWADPGTFKAQARRFRPDARELLRAADKLAAAARPLILVGGGVHLSDAYAALLALADKQGMPVAHTMSGKGAIPCTHPFVGRPVRGAIRASPMNSSKLPIVCSWLDASSAKLRPNGSSSSRQERPSSTSIFCRRKSVARHEPRLHLPAMRGLRWKILPQRWNKTRRSSACGFEYLAEIQQRMAAWREGAAERLQSREAPINIGRVMGELNAVMPEDAILVADGGFAGHWGGLLFDTKRAGRGFVADRGFASIGYGVPGGLGAQLGAGKSRRGRGAHRRRRLQHDNWRARDGEAPRSQLYHLHLQQCRIRLREALQHAVYGPGSYQSSDLTEFDYGIARAMGCSGIRVTDPEQLQPALREALANTNIPTVVDIVVTRDPAKILPGTDNRTLTVSQGRQAGVKSLAGVGACACLNECRSGRRGFHTHKSPRCAPRCPLESAGRP